MAALTRPTQATYEVHENISVDTQDNEDHTFCGIMFPVKCKALLPLDHLLIKSVAVRGRLGPLTVWVSNPEEHQNLVGAGLGARRVGPEVAAAAASDARPQQQRIRLDPRCWTKLYDKCHAASRTEYAELVLEQPIRLVPGQTRVIYIHSTLPGDEAIVYDNSSFYGYSQTQISLQQNQPKRYEDDKLLIQSGRAHVSNEVFGQEPIWGWGNAWRDRREFVGRLRYGTVYKLWSPYLFDKFGPQFQKGARTLFLCQRRWESPFSMLSDECIFYILNMCPWHHFDDDSDKMKERKKQEKMRLQKQQQQQQATEDTNDTEMQGVAVASNNAVTEDGNEDEEEEEDTKPAALCASRCEAARQRVCAMLEDDEDADEEYKEDEDEDRKLADADDDRDYFEGDAVVDPDEMEEYVPSEDDEDDDDAIDEEDEWSEESEEGHYYRANVEAFTFQEINSDSEEEVDQEEHVFNQREFMGQVHRMLFARRGIP